MENCLTCTCEEMVETKVSGVSFIERITSFLTTFVVEGAEHLARTK